MMNKLAHITPPTEPEAWVFAAIVLIGIGFLVLCGIASHVYIAMQGSVYRGRIEEVQTRIGWVENGSLPRRQKEKRIEELEVELQSARDLGLTPMRTTKVILLSSLAILLAVVVVVCISLGKSYVDADKKYDAESVKWLSEISDWAEDKYGVTAGVNEFDKYNTVAGGMSCPNFVEQCWITDAAITGAEGKRELKRVTLAYVAGEPFLFTGKHNDFAELVTVDERITE